MISFRIGIHRFHYRAAAIVVDDGHLLLHRLEGDDFWALPGGRVNAGEDAQAAIAREFDEELGSSIECSSLACTGENFFEYGGEPYHEIGLYFHARLPAGSPLLDKSRTHVGVEGHQRLEFRWWAVRDLGSVDMHPRALQRGLASGTMPRHFVQRD